MTMVGWKEECEHVHNIPNMNLNDIILSGLERRVERYNIVG